VASVGSSQRLEETKAEGSYIEFLMRSSCTRNMSASTSTLPRRHHTELQPLATKHDAANGNGRASSIPSCVTMTNTSTLPSPSVVAARAYFLEKSPPIGQNPNALQWRRSLIEAQEFPRRHSAIPTPGGLATDISSFKVACPDQNVEVVPEAPESESNVRTNGSEDVSMTGIKQNDLVKLTAVATAGPIDAVAVPVAEVLQQVPFQYTHDRLRNWGHAYLGNAATADAFINAVGLRRPSLQLVTENNAEDLPEPTGMVTIRARVHPNAKERKPFVIQRKCDIEELRANIPAMQQPVLTALRRSNRVRRSSSQLSSARLRRTPVSLRENLPQLGRSAVPIRE
jgi:hypothetical protein